MNTIFVYGTLRRDERNHNYLQYAEYIDTDLISGFIMLDFGDYPVIIESDISKKVFVEIYNVNEYTLKMIDDLEEYYGENSDDNLYNRRFVQSKKGYTGYIYTGVSTDKFPGAVPIKSGDWKLRKNKTKVR